MLTNHETETVVDSCTYSGSSGTSNPLSTQYVKVTSIRFSERAIDELDAAAAKAALAEPGRLSDDDVRRGLGL